MKTQVSCEITMIGIDIAKDVFHVVGFNADRQIALRHKVPRLALTDFVRLLPRCLVDTKTCLSAHFVSRMLRGMARSL